MDSSLKARTGKASGCRFLSIKLVLLAARFRMDRMWFECTLASNLCFRFHSLAMNEAFIERKEKGNIASFLVCIALDESDITFKGYASCIDLDTFDISRAYSMGYMKGLMV